MQVFLDQALLSVHYTVYWIFIEFKSLFNLNLNDFSDLLNEF